MLKITKAISELVENNTGSTILEEKPVMKFQNSCGVNLPPEGHLIEVIQCSFGFSLTHVSNGRLVYTASYPSIAEAERRAHTIAHGLNSSGETVYLCINNVLKNLS